MSKRVQIAVIREATLNAKPTDTHYLAAGGLQISRKDAVALKGTTLYYKVMVDLGEIKGGDFISGRDIPVYLTDSDPVLVLQPQLIHLVDAGATPVEITVKHVTVTPETSVVKQEVVAPVPIEASKAEITPVPADAIVKRRPGRPKKVVAEVAPVVAEVATTPLVETPQVEEASAEPIVEEPAPAFEVSQDDESTFLIAPTGIPAQPIKPTQPEFSFEVDEDEAPPPPPVRETESSSLDFVVEDDPVEVQPSAPVEIPDVDKSADGSSNTDDYSDVDTGMFDE